MMVWTPYIKLTLGLVITGFLFHFVGYVTPFWNGDGHISTGLWMKCGDALVTHTYYTSCHAYLSPSAGYMVARCFETIAFFGYIGLFIFLGCYINNDTHKFLMMSLIISWTIVVFSLSGVIAWAATSAYHLNWSFVITLLSVFITSGAGVILLRERFYTVWV